MKHAIMSLYNNANSRIDINGHRSSDIQIQCAIRQGCPLSSILYALTINPFLMLITRHLRGLNIGNGNKKTVCIAYADDITVVCRDKRDVRTLQRIIQLYGLASGAQVNWTKCSALPIGRWNQTRELQRIRYTTTAKILSIYFGTNIAHTIDTTWKDKTHKIKGSVRDSNTRKFDLRFGSAMFGSSKKFGTRHKLFLSTTSIVNKSSRQ
jgi:hypothetical protein